MDRLLQSCSRETGYDRQEPSEGHTEELGACFGVFSVKLFTGILREGSPGKLRDRRCRVIFRENNGLRKRLKL